MSIISDLVHKYSSRFEKFNNKNIGAVIEGRKKSEKRKNLVKNLVFASALSILPLTYFIISPTLSDIRTSSYTIEQLVVNSKPHNEKEKIKLQEYLLENFDSKLMRNYLEDYYIENKYVNNNYSKFEKLDSLFFDRPNETTNSENSSKWDKRVDEIKGFGRNHIYLNKEMFFLENDLTKKSKIFHLKDFNLVYDSGEENLYAIDSTFKKLNHLIKGSKNLLLTYPNKNSLSDLETNKDEDIETKNEHHCAFFIQDYNDLIKYDEEKNSFKNLIKTNDRTFMNEINSPFNNIYVIFKNVPELGLQISGFYDALETDSNKNKLKLLRQKSNIIIEDIFPNKFSKLRVVVNDSDSLPNNYSLYLNDEERIMVLDKNDKIREVYETEVFGEDIKNYNVRSINSDEYTDLMLHRGDEIEVYFGTKNSFKKVKSFKISDENTIYKIMETNYTPPWFNFEEYIDEICEKFKNE